MNYCGLSVLALFELLLVCSRTSAYYNKSYDEYRLTIRDGAGNENYWATQSGAQQWCRDNLNGSLLASVTNSGLQTNIQQFANDAFSASMFSENNIIVNAQLELSDWRWLNGQGVTTTDVKGQSNESNYRLYAYLRTTNYTLTASKSTNNRSYLCQNSGDTIDCGENGFRFSGRCYRKYDRPRVSWFDARINCQGEGGDLASFDQTGVDLSRLNSLEPYLATSTDYWVGLKRLKWKWLDTGSEANYTYWTDGRPSDYSMKCICLGARNIYNWTWIECDCNQNYQFICLTVLSTTLSSPRTTLVSSATFQSMATPSSTSATGSLASAGTNYSHASSSTSNHVSSTPEDSGSSGSSQQNKSTLAIGLGVGLGVGVPLVVLVVVTVALLTKKRRRQPPKRPLVNGSSVSPPMELKNNQEISEENHANGVYATVVQQKEGNDEHHSPTDTGQQPVVYANIEHVNQLQ